MAENNSAEVHALLLAEAYAPAPGGRAGPPTAGGTSSEEDEAAPGHGLGVYHRRRRRAGRRITVAVLAAYRGARIPLRWHWDVNIKRS